jgi:uroporphyrinogen-III decarboxylase
MTYARGLAAIRLEMPDAVRQEVKRCMDLGRGCPGYFFAVGNHIPPNVQIENADACIQAYLDLRKR